MAQIFIESGVGDGPIRRGDANARGLAADRDGFFTIFACSGVLFNKNPSPHQMGRGIKGEGLPLLPLIRVHSRFSPEHDD